MIRYLYAFFKEKGRLFTPFLFAVILLSLIGAFTVKTVIELSGDYKFITERYRVNQGLGKILAKNILGQNELRAFYLTGDTTYIREYRADVDTIHHLLRYVDSIISAPEQQQLLDSLHLVVEERMQFNEAKLRLYLKEGNAAAQKKYLTQYGQELTRVIDSLIVVMQTREENALTVHHEQLMQRTKLTLALILFGGITSVVLLVVIFVKLNREIQQRIKSEQNIRESEQRLFNFLEAVPAGVYILNADGKPYYANEVAKRILGQGIVPNASPENLTEVYHAYRQNSNTIYPTEELPIIRALRGERSAISDIEIRKADAVVPLFVTGAPIYDSNGVLQYAMAAFIDITQQKNAELKLAESEERFRQIIEYATDIIYRTDRNGNLTYVNPVGLKMFGFTEEEALGMNYVNLVRAEEKETVRRFYLRQAASKTPHTYFEFSAQTKEGKSIILGQNVQLLLRDNHVEGFLVVARDITEKKLSEEALRQAKEAAESATRAKSLFLATMSHEIRTPMNGVIGMTDLLLQTELTKEQREYAETIRNSGETLLTLINDILDFSKIESGKLELERRPIDLQQLIEESLDLVAHRATEKNIDLLYFIDHGVPPYIIGDPVRLKQILLNLTNNAIKFTERGEVFISVKEISRKNGHAILEVAVKDTGIGIPKEKISQLFAAFTQVDASITRKFGGTGLGLAITKRLVELMDGTIWIESDVGKGTTVFFRITVGTTDASALPPKKYVGKNIPELQGKRVLIVDDNATNLNILSIQSSLWGMHPRVTASPQEALKWLDAGDPFDLAILDFHMPEMNGVELAREIHVRRKSLPLLLFSSSGRSEFSAEENTLFAAVVMKPIKQSQLHSTLITVLTTSKPQMIEKQPTQRTTMKKIADEFPLSILIAEDNIINQKLAVRLLQQMGYSADLAQNGREVLQMVEKKKYDIIFMDIHMPEMDGFEATRELVRRYDARVRPKIIAMTADAMSGDKEKCIDAGMDDYISKPVRLEGLQAMLKAYGEVIVKNKTAVHTPLTDEDYMRARLQGMLNETDREFFEEMVRTIPTQTNEILSDIRSLWEQRDVQKVIFAAHKLRGVALNFGAIALAEALKKIEHADPSYLLQQGQTLIDDVQREVLRSHEMLTKVLATMMVQ